MKWVLIIIRLSGWDSSPTDWHYVAKYETQQTCESERDALNARAYYARYICANEAVDRVEKP